MPGYLRREESAPIESSTAAAGAGSCGDWLVRSNEDLVRNVESDCAALASGNMAAMTRAVESVVST
jgi:hypothetical protein